MIKISLFTGQIECGTPQEAAEFWYAYMKKLIPGLEEQCKKTGEDYAKSVFEKQFGPAIGKS